MAAAGCGEDFDPYTRLTSLRVLAIKSEVTTQPANASGGLQVSPGPGETATLTPLMFVPDGDVITAWSWRWCPLAGSPNNGYQCAFASADDVMMMTGAHRARSSTWATRTPRRSPTAFLPSSSPGCAAGLPGVLAAPNCEGGYPIQIEMRVESMNDPGIDVVSTLRLRIDSPTPPLPPMPPNYNPVLDPTTGSAGGDPRLRCRSDADPRRARIRR